MVVQLVLFINILHHVIANVIGHGREPRKGEPEDSLMQFVVLNGIPDIRVLLTMSVDEFRSLGYDPVYTIRRSLATINKWYHEDSVADMDEDDEVAWFWSLTKNGLMRKAMAYGKVSELPTPPSSGDVANVQQTTIELADTPLPTKGNAKAALEAARSRRSSMAVYTGTGGGRPPLVPVSTPKVTQTRVSFAPTTTYGATPFVASKPVPPAPAPAVAPVPAPAPVDGPVSLCAS